MDKNMLKVDAATCVTCPYWKHTPESPHIVALEMAIGKNNAKPLKLETGICFYTRPMLQPMAVQGKLAGQVSMQIQRIFPQMFENEFCADHPNRALAREHGLEMAREAARRGLAEFSPEKHGDAHAGFNAPPSLQAAKKIAAVADSFHCVGTSNGEHQWGIDENQASYCVICGFRTV